MTTPPANVSFTHPLLPSPLLIYTNPDQVLWSYGLNTSVYPTYGGEVVQILSIYFGDMSISGTVSSYAKLEEIYTWFIAYMQYATQGRDHPSFDQQPVTFTYLERSWQFTIWPKALPGFRYGRDVVAPTWQLTAAVKEPDTSFADDLKTFLSTPEAFHKAHPNTDNFSNFGVATADFGTTGDLTSNPWASPDADPTLKGSTMQAWQTKHTKTLADLFSSFVGDYSNDTLGQLPAFSKPPTYNPGAPTGNTLSSKQTKGKSNPKGAGKS